MANLNQDSTNKGFTIVELLVVIVVIAILASITIVSYNGIQSRANNAAVQSDLRSFATLSATYAALNGDNQAAGLLTADYLAALQWKASKGSYDTSVAYNLAYCHNRTTLAQNNTWATDRNGRTNWTLVAKTKSGAVYYITDAISTPTLYTGPTMLFTGDTCAQVISNLGAPGFTGVYHGWVASDTTTGPWRSFTGN